MKTLLPLALVPLLAACAPAASGPVASTSTAAGAKYDYLVGKRAPLVVVTTPQGAVLHRFAVLLDDVETVEGLALYDSVAAPGYGTLTSLSGNRLLYLNDPSKGAAPAGEKPAYPGLLCVATAAGQGGTYEGQAHSFNPEDRSALLAIAAGVNAGEEGAEEALAKGVAEAPVLGKCVIDVDYLGG